MSGTNEKESFWHSFRIFSRELDECEQEIRGEIPATEKHIDAHIKELEERSGVLIETYKRLFGE